MKITLILLQNVFLLQTLDIFFVLTDSLRLQSQKQNCVRCSEVILTFFLFFQNVNCCNFWSRKLICSKSVGKPSQTSYLEDPDIQFFFESRWLRNPGKHLYVCGRSFFFFFFFEKISKKIWLKKKSDFVQNDPKTVLKWFLDEIERTFFIEISRENSFFVSILFSLFFFFFKNFLLSLHISRDTIAISHFFAGKTGGSLIRRDSNDICRFQIQNHFSRKKVSALYIFMKKKKKRQK